MAGDSFLLVCIAAAVVDGKNFIHVFAFVVYANEARAEGSNLMNINYNPRNGSTPANYSINISIHGDPEKEPRSIKNSYLD